MSLVVVAAEVAEAVKAEVAEATIASAGRRRKCMLGTHNACSGWACTGPDTNSDSQ